MTGRGYLLAESLRPGTWLEGLPLELQKVERFDASDPAPGQPSTWTGIEVTFPAADVERVADTLAAALGPHRWWADLHADGETFIVFAGRVFRFPTGDRAASAEARAYGIAVGVPPRQLDWN
jgi:hypothetical protein